MVASPWAKIRFIGRRRDTGQLCPSTRRRSYKLNFQHVHAGIRCLDLDVERVAQRGKCSRKVVRRDGPLPCRRARLRIGRVQGRYLLPAWPGTIISAIICATLPIALSCDAISLGLDAAGEGLSNLAAGNASIRWAGLVFSSSIFPSSYRAAASGPAARHRPLFGLADASEAVSEIAIRKLDHLQ